MQITLEKKEQLKTNIKKYFKWLIIFVIFTLLAVSILELIYSFDDNKVAVEQFVQNSPLITSKVGRIEKLYPRGWLNFSGTKTEKPFKEYRYSIRGSNANAYVRVRFDISNCDKGNDCCFEIYSIE